MGGGEASVRYLSGIIILENGMESEFALREDAVRLMEQEANERYYKASIAKKAVSAAAYEAASVLK